MRATNSEILQGNECPSTQGYTTDTTYPDEDCALPVELGYPMRSLEPEKGVSAFSQQPKTYPDEDSTLPVELGEAVVVDVELREQQLVLVGGDGALESLHRLLGRHPALLHQTPETRVVQVVDVTYKVLQFVNMSRLCWITGPKCLPDVLLPFCRAPYCTLK